jgi:hypothetical protein
MWRFQFDLNEHNRYWTRMNWRHHDACLCKNPERVAKAEASERQKLAFAPQEFQTPDEEWVDKEFKNINDIT